MHQFAEMVEDSSHGLQREPPPSQDPSACACCAVVATDIEWKVTPAEARGQGKREMEAAQEDNAKKLWFDPRDVTCETSSRSTLRTYKRLAGMRQSATQVLASGTSVLTLLHAVNLVCFLARTPLVGGRLVLHRSELQSMMVGSTPGRLQETKRHHGLLANMGGDGPAALPLQGDERRSSACNRTNWPNTLRTAPARRSEGPDRPQDK